jgi:hypothetical protein
MGHKSDLEGNKFQKHFIKTESIQSTGKQQIKSVIQRIYLYYLIIYALCLCVFFFFQFYIATISMSIKFVYPEQFILKFVSSLSVELE